VVLDRQAHRFTPHWERLVLDTCESLRSDKGFRYMGNHGKWTPFGTTSQLGGKRHRMYAHRGN